MPRFFVIARLSLLRALCVSSPAAPLCWYLNSSCGGDVDSAVVGRPPVDGGAPVPAVGRLGGVLAQETRGRRRPGRQAAGRGSGRRPDAPGLAGDATPGISRDGDPVGAGGSFSLVAHSSSCIRGCWVARAEHGPPAAGGCPRGAAGTGVDAHSGRCALRLRACGSAHHVRAPAGDLLGQRQRAPTPLRGGSPLPPLSATSTSERRKGGRLDAGPGGDAGRTTPDR